MGIKQDQKASYAAYFNRLRKRTDGSRAVGAPVQYTRWDHSGHQMEKLFLKKEPWVDWMFAQSLRQRPSRPDQNKKTQ